MKLQEIIEKSNEYYFIISDGMIYTSEGYASDIKLGEEVFDLTINEIPKEKYVPENNVGKWIPVSERLPKEHICDDGYVEPSEYVLVFGDYGDYGISRYWGNRVSKSERPNAYNDWVDLADLDWVVQKPIAWMPLPTGYKGEENG